MHWLRCIGSFSAVAVALSLIACNQAQETDNPPRVKPKANQATEAGKPPSFPPFKAQEAPPSPEALADRRKRREETLAALRRKFQQAISTPAPLKMIRANDTVTIPVVVKNTSEETWSATGDTNSVGAVHLAYHWLKPPSDGEQQNSIETRPVPETRQRTQGLPQATRLSQKSRGKMVEFEGLRTPLPHDLKPGEQAALSATIQGPPQAGEFILRLTMVEERVAWFEQRGGQPLDLSVMVMAQ